MSKPPYERRLPAHNWLQRTALARRRCTGALDKEGRRANLRAVRTLVVLVVLGLAATAAAQIARPFTARFTTNVTGDISIIGNTLLYCPKPGTSGCTGNNNSYSMVHFKDTKDTPDATVLNRSTADLALPVGATVAWAGLYWGGRSGSVNFPANRNQMQFRTPLTPQGTYETITSQIPLDTFTSGNLTAYQGYVRDTCKNRSQEHC